MMLLTSLCSCNRFKRVLSFSWFHIFNWCWKFDSIVLLSNIFLLMQSFIAYHETTTLLPPTFYTKDYYNSTKIQTENGVNVTNIHMYISSCVRRWHALFCDLIASGAVTCTKWRRLRFPWAFRNLFILRDVARYKELPVNAIN